MDKSNFNVGLIAGILGSVAGLAIIFTGQILIGAFGTIASLGVALQSHRDPNK